MFYPLFLPYFSLSPPHHDDWRFFDLSPHPCHWVCVQMSAIWISVCVYFITWAGLPSMDGGEYISVHTHICVCVYPEPCWPIWPSAISTGADSSSRQQLNLHPRGQSSGRKQMHMRQPGLCGRMTYALTCVTDLAGFDSLGSVLRCLSIISWPTLYFLTASAGFSSRV